MMFTNLALGTKSELKCFLVVLVDVDECQFPGACQADHVCNNTVGSYRCECPLGFVADSGPQDLIVDQDLVHKVHKIILITKCIRGNSLRAIKGEN